jgi:hypothetical protein
MNNEPFQKVQGQIRELFSRLPDKPVSSNFTARVLRAVELEELRGSRQGVFKWNWRSFFPRITVAASVAVLAGVALQLHEHSLVRREMAKDVAMVASQPAPSVEALNNFDAIQRMSQTGRPDEDLIALASDMK